MHNMDANLNIYSNNAWLQIFVLNNKFFFIYYRGQCMVLIDAAKGCATEPPDLEKYPADFVVLSFYKVRKKNEGKVLFDSIPSFSKSIVQCDQSFAVFIIFCTQV